MASVVAERLGIERKDLVARIVEPLVADADGQLEDGVPRDAGEFAERPLGDDAAGGNDTGLSG